MKKHKTEQELFWAGQFGDDYTIRNEKKELLASNLYFFSQILNRVSGVQTVLELGANIGLNIVAINNLLPDSKTSAVEINPRACRELKKVCTGRAYLSTIIDFDEGHDERYDLVFTKGVLIHISPRELDATYRTIYNLTKRYICVAEYYAPEPVAIDYRGNKNKLFKRDFAGDLLAKYSDLSLLGYGFCYHLDVAFPQDDISWFLLEKTRQGRKTS